MRLLAPVKPVLTVPARHRVHVPSRRQQPAEVPSKRPHRHPHLNPPTALRHPGAGQRLVVNALGRHTTFPLLPDILRALSLCRRLRRGTRVPSEGVPIPLGTDGSQPASLPLKPRTSPRDPDGSQLGAFRDRSAEGRWRCPGLRLLRLDERWRPGLAVAGRWPREHGPEGGGSGREDGDFGRISHVRTGPPNLVPFGPPPRGLVQPARLGAPVTPGLRSFCGRGSRRVKSSAPITRRSGSIVTPVHPVVRLRGPITLHTHFLNQPAKHGVGLPQAILHGDRFTEPTL